MISWEFSQAPSHNALNDTDWDNPNLVSIIVMREPISRLLAGDGYVKKKYPGIHDNTASLQDWWDFAHEHHHTNNFALSILAGQSCCQGEDTDPIHLEHAKELLSRFTFVLDISCLDEGMQAVADELGLGIVIEESKERAKTHVHKHPRDRIAYPEVYDYLLERNHLDIELYEWAKTISLVDCEALKEKGVSATTTSQGTPKEAPAVSNQKDPNALALHGDTTNTNPLQQTQVESFKEGKALMVNVHLT